MRKLVMATMFAAVTLPGIARAQTTGPTVSPTAGAPAPAAPVAAAPAAAPAPLFWRQSLINYTVSMNLNVLDPSLQLTRNPTVDMSLSLRPRFTLSRMLQVRAGLDLAHEFTNSDSTTTINEPRFSDPFVDLWITGIPAAGPFKFWVAPRLAFPVSPESRAATRILTTGLVLQGAIGVEHFLGGDLTIIANGTYTHHFHQYTTPSLRSESLADRGYATTCYPIADTSCSAQGSGVANPSDVLAWSVILAPSWGIWSPGVFFRMQHVFPYTFSGVPGTSQSANGNTVRNNTAFAVWLDVNPTPWFTLEVGYSMARNLLRADGTYGNPVYDENQDMRLYVSTVFTIDKLYQAIAGSGQGAGGVIRTQNNPRRGAIVGAMF